MCPRPRKTVLKTKKANEFRLLRKAALSLALFSYLLSSKWYRIERVPRNIWCTDLHAGPIACQLHMFQSLGFNITAQIDFHNCKFFEESYNSSFCARNLRVFSRDSQRGYSLDPDPRRLKKRFYEEYKNDEQFMSTSFIFCSHPAANCELYLQFGKRIVIYNTQRIEFGRDDKFVWWRRPIFSKDSKERWAEWVNNIRAIAASDKNIVATNNMYDAKYTEYFTGVRSHYIPSWCGGSILDYTNEYSPHRKELVLVPYRSNLFHDRRAVPRESWPNPTKRTFSDPLSHGIFQGLPEHLHLINLKEAFPPKGNFKNMKEFGMFTAALFIPYVPSTMFFFEMYRSNIPMLVPSETLLQLWVHRHRILWETSYGDPDVLDFDLSKKETGFLNLPNPNRFDAASRHAWFQFYDVYRRDSFPHLIYFDSWEHAAALVRSMDFKKVSKRMAKHNFHEYHRIQKLWSALFQQSIKVS